MAVDLRHVGQAEHNEAAYHLLDATSADYGDWQVTMLFYAAVHYVNAFLARRQITVGSHEQRMYWVRTVSNLRPHQAEYASLQDRSLESRYNLVRFTRDRARQVYVADYRPLRDAMRHMLNLPHVPDPPATVT